MGFEPEKLAGHAQVNPPVALVQNSNQILAAPLPLLHGAPGQGLAKANPIVSRRCDHPVPVNPDAGDREVLAALLQPAPHGLDFGQLGHGPSKSRHAPSMGGDGCCCDA